MILALVYAARKLRRYFQAHPIQVLSNKPIKQILAKPEKLGRIAKWAIELGEHEIKFKGRNSIKGKILVDFLAETPLTENREAKNEEVKRKEPKPENAWKLFTDGASSSDGSGAGLVVVSPEGKEYTYALRFEFETTNNEAEYEALLAGLRIVKEMEIRELIIFVDSQLVANQVKGLFEARQPTIKQYLEKMIDLLSEVLVEVIQNKSITEKGVADIVKEEGDNWRTPIREYLRSGSLLNDPQKARKLRIKALLYKMIEEKLYRRSYLSPWLRCVGPMHAKNIIKEVHEGSCGMHSGPRNKCGTKRVQDFDPKENEKRRQEDLDILKERREMASIKEAHYKQKLEGYYNKNVKPSTFKPGTYVLPLNSASKAEYQVKIGPTWEGPYVIRKAYGDGAYKLETLSGEAVDRTWNRTNLHKDLERDPDRVGRSDGGFFDNSCSREVIRSK
ncbi:reverse transcriptase domain-containing protein [Tanacetum coccineum]